MPSNMMIQMFKILCIIKGILINPVANERILYLITNGC